MKTKIVAIGNSQGVRIPKPLLEEANLGEGAEVDLRLTPDGLVIERVSSPRRGWADAAAELAVSDSSDEDPFVATQFDEEDWEW